MEIINFKEIDSTYSEAMRRSDKLGKGEYLFCAEAQTLGRGQGDHTFFSPRGGIYATLLIKGGFDGISPTAVGSHLTPLAAVCLANAIKELTDAGDRLKVKWINDIQLDGKKLGGILSGCRIINGEISSVAIGFGVNTGCAALPPEIENTAASLPLSARARARLTSMTALSIIERCREIALPDSKIYCEYTALCSTVGKMLRFEDGSIAKATAVTRDFGLETESPDGCRRILRSTAGVSVL